MSAAPTTEAASAETGKPISIFPYLYLTEGAGKQAEKARDLSLEIRQKPDNIFQVQTEMVKGYQIAPHQGTPSHH